MSIFDTIECPNCKLILNVDDVQLPSEMKMDFIEKTAIASIEENRINEALKPTAIHAIRLLEEAVIHAEKAGKKALAARLARLKHFVVADLKSNATVAQLAERQICNLNVVGSIPTGSSEEKP